MNASNPRNRIPYSPLQATVLAVAFAMSSACAVAGGMGETVTSKQDQNLDERHGRDSVTALSPSPIMMPAQPEPQRFGRAGGFVGTDRVMQSAPSAPSSAAVKTGETGAGNAADMSAYPSDSATTGDRLHNTQ
jgi:hypothetical protein